MRRLAGITLAAAVALMLSGCGLSVYNAPLPGGADLGSHPISLAANFDDVLDLVPQSSVKLDNIDVGKVDKITLNPDGHSAHVVLKVNGSVDLPAGTTARVQQTSLLGEKYVALVRPDASSPGASLKSGDLLGLADTSQSATVEQVFGALSLVLNGGGIGQFQEISRELQKVSAGRPEKIKGFLRELDTFATGVDQRKEAITAALDGVAALSKTLDADKGKIVNALDELSPGMQVLVDQRKQLVAMLKALDRLSSVTVDTLNHSQKDIVADLKALQPILDQLAKSGSDLPNALQILLTYPFPDSVLGAIKGDYLNVFITTNFHTLPAGCHATGCSWPQVAGTLTQSSRKGAPHGSLLAPAPSDAPPSLLPPTSSPLAGLPSPTISVPTKEPTATGSATSAPSSTASASGTPSPTADASASSGSAGSSASKEGEN